MEEVNFRGHLSEIINNRIRDGVIEKNPKRDKIPNQKLPP